MGEVYRARDSRLNRDVAIKILRTDGTAGTDLRSRFEREARAVAALNHPNIVAVYDFGIEQDQQYIVSELIEGESLRALLRGKVVPSRKLVDITSQVADGLAAAHAAGIVHRDLKPENIMIAKDGRVKILDFGLARKGGSSGILAGSEDITLADAPQANQNITGKGVVIGTPNYMSPEQALGHELNYHSDQFSFGLILYELASGKQAFAKMSTIETMAAIVREEPAPMDEKLPPPLRWIIDRCLAKEPEQRYESTRDLYRDLKNLRDHFSEAYPSSAFPQIATAPSKASYKKFASICLACIVPTALLVYALRPEGQNFGDLRYTPLAVDASGGFWSPDGRSVAYTHDVNGTLQTFLKYLDSPTAVQLTHEKMNTRPMGWSADGSHIIVAEWSQAAITDKLYSLATVGGEPEFIMTVDNFAATLSRDGKALAVLQLETDNHLSIKISDPLGSPFVLYQPVPIASRNPLYRPEVSTPKLYFAPDGKNLLLVQDGKNNDQEIWLLPYPSGARPPEKVLSQLTSEKSAVRLEWMPDNRHLIVSRSPHSSDRNHLWMADLRSGDLTRLTNGTGDESFPHVSPNGASLLYTELRVTSAVVSISLLDGSATTMINTGREERAPSWSSRDGLMSWVTNRNGSSEIWVRTADGTERPLISAQDLPDAQSIDQSISPAGDRIIFTKSDPSGVLRLWIASLSGGPPIRLTSVQSGPEIGGSWSPDGSRFIYSQMEGNRVSLMVAKTTGGAKPSVLKIDGCELSNWSPTGEWIACDAGKGWILLSPDGKSVKPLGISDTPRVLFSKDGKFVYGVLNTDIKSGKPSATLVRLDIATLKQTVIRQLDMDFRPSFDSGPFSMAPDGKSFVYSISKTRRDIWMLQGFKQPSWLDRFSLH